MRVMRWIGLTAWLTLTLATAANAHASRHHARKTTSAHAASAPPSASKVLQLFEVIHIGDALHQMNSQMAGVMAQTVPCVPASYWQGFIDAGSTRQVLEQMVPVYQSHFTAADVEGLLKFYRSPLGRKVIAEMPATMAEAATVGQQWGVKRRQQMLARLQQSGTLDDQGRCPADPAAASSSSGLLMPGTLAPAARSLLPGKAPTDSVH